MYSAIFTMDDRITKFVILDACNFEESRISNPKTTHLFFDNFARFFRVSASVVHDHNLIFIFAFW